MAPRRTYDLSDDMKKMTGQLVHNPNQFGNAWVAADNMGSVSVFLDGSCYTL